MAVLEEMKDSDLDGIPDMYENMIDHLDPNNPDSDGDGIPDMDDDDPPLPPWAEEMAKNNDWTPQPDANGVGGGLEGFSFIYQQLLQGNGIKVDEIKNNNGEPIKISSSWNSMSLNYSWYF